MKTKKTFFYKDIFANKEKILFVTAHPDDVDVFFGGTIARLANDDKKVKVVVVTNGARGSRQNDISEDELGKLRENEEKNALSHLGLKKSAFQSFGYLDGAVENTMELIGKIAGVIRDFRPDIVCTHEPHNYYGISTGSNPHYYVNHRDHRNVGISTMDAIYPFSRDISFFKEQILNGMDSHTVKEILLSFDTEVNTKIDITEFIKDKKRALLAHKSQFDQDTVDNIIKRFKKGRKYYEYAKYVKLAW